MSGKETLRPEIQIVSSNSLPNQNLKDYQTCYSLQRQPFYLSVLDLNDCVSFATLHRDISYLGICQTGQGRERGIEV